MKLDERDFRRFDGKFYPQVPTDLIVDCFGHKQVHFKQTHGHGAFVYLNAKRRQFLHAQQYSDSFDLVAWVRQHQAQLSLLITETPVPELKDELPQFIVPNAWEFYKAAASYSRQLYDGNVIAITGSVGKSTTRLMTVELLRALKRHVNTNIGNENVRQVVIPLLATTLQNPDDLVAEISINALNNRDGRQGVTARYYAADAAIITQVGGAHLAELSNVDDLLMFLAERKSRIFDEMPATGRAILNYDMEPRVYRYLVDVAHQHTDHLYSYSYADQHADAYVVKTEDFRDHTAVTMAILGETVTANLSMPGKGVILDLLAACLTLKSLELPLPDITNLFMNFEALNSELKFYEIPTSHGKVTIVDDTHGSTLHSVNNVISVFKARGQFYAGQKVLVMETGEDLGADAAAYNLQFKEPLLTSHVDTLIGYRDDAIKPLVDAVQPQLKTGFYQDLAPVQAAIDQLPNDSLVIIKSSDGRKYGSDLWTLPEKLLHATSEV